MLVFLVVSLFLSYCIFFFGFYFYFFFFKQKTAYEMRISDWSSDVCSSDLDGPVEARRGRRTHPVHERLRSSAREQRRVHRRTGAVARRRVGPLRRRGAAARDRRPVRRDEGLDRRIDRKRVV